MGSSTVPDTTAATDDRTRGPSFVSLLEATELEALRRESIGRERAVRLLGRVMGILGLVFCSVSAFLIAIGVLILVRILPSLGFLSGQQEIAGAMVASGLISLVPGCFFFFTGRGLCRLRGWARGVWTAITALVLVYVMWVAAFSVFDQFGATLMVVAMIGGPAGLVLALLASEKTGVVFSPEYREVVVATREIGAGREKESAGFRLYIPVRTIVMIAIAAGLTVVMALAFIALGG